MILYSIISADDIFYKPPEQTSYLNEKGRYFEIAHCENGNRIRRVISTDLNDYLNQNYDIGKFIK